LADEWDKTARRLSTSMPARNGRAVEDVEPRPS
jgi:hypothetical protein